MKHFYLFCNNRYGESFHRIFTDFAKRHADIKCVVVFSGSDGRTHSRYKPVRLLKKAYRDLLDSYLPGETLFCKDVNSSEFVSGIPNGSIGFIAGFNQIFRENCISRFAELINFHPSVLPYYRGAIPSYWVLQNGETRSGYTAHRVVEKIDAGPILHQQCVDIATGLDEHGLDRLIANTASGYFIGLLETLASGQELEPMQLDSPYRKPAGYMPSKRKE